MSLVLTGQIVKMKTNKKLVLREKAKGTDT